MQISSLVGAVVITLLFAVVRPFERVEAVALTNQANLSSSLLTALAWPRGLQESPLNLTSKTKKIVTRQASEQNFTADNFRATNWRATAEEDPATSGDKNEEGDGLGNNFHNSSDLRES